MKRRDMGNPEITPLIDIVFLLLIFFMVSSVFKNNESGLELKLPKSSSMATIEQKKELKIEMTEKEIAFNGEQCSLKSLQQRLAALASDKPLPVLLYIDEMVPYKRVMSLLDVLQKYGFADIALISQNTKEM